jgi:hypothetical protein
VTGGNHGATPTGCILFNLVDATRQPLPANTKWSAIIRDRRSLDEWHGDEVNRTGLAELFKNLTYFENLFVNCTVIVSAKGCQGAAWRPVHISPEKPAPVDLMPVPEDAHVNFSGAKWQTLKSVRPQFAQVISAGITDSAARYGNLMEPSEGRCWPACLTCSPPWPKPLCRAVLGEFAVGQCEPVSCRTTPARRPQPAARFTHPANFGRTAFEVIRHMTRTREKVARTMYSQITLRVPSTVFCRAASEPNSCKRRFQ